MIAKQEGKGKRRKMDGTLWNITVHSSLPLTMTKRLIDSLYKLKYKLTPVLGFASSSPT